MKLTYRDIPVILSKEGTTLTPDFEFINFCVRKDDTTPIDRFDAFRPRWKFSEPFVAWTQDTLSYKLIKARNGWVRHFNHCQGLY